MPIVTVSRRRSSAKRTVFSIWFIPSPTPNLLPLFARGSRILFSLVSVFFPFLAFPIDLDPKCLPSLDSLKLNGMNLSPKPALPTVYSTLSLPSLDPVPDDDGLDATQPEMQSETQQRSAVDLFDEQSGEKAMLSPVHDDTEELANHTNDGELPHFGFHSLPFCRTILRALNSPDPETIGEYPKQAIPCSNSTLMGRIEVGKDEQTDVQTVLNSTRSNSQDVFEDSETAIFNDEAPVGGFWFG